MRVGRLPLGILIWMLGAIIILIGLVYVELTPAATSASVLSRRERIEPDLTGTSWVRHAEVLARYQVNARTYERWIRLDLDTYDAVERGSSLDIRYASVNAEWARPESQSTLEALLQRVQPWQTFTWLVLAGGLVFAFLRHREWRLDRWWMLRRSPAERALLLGLVLGWLAIVVAGYFPPPWPEVSDSQRDGTTEARIRNVTTITQFGGGNRESENALPIGLPQGFHRVELSFIPDGWDGAVVAVDEVDENSAGELNVGENVPVHYDPEHPRDARMDIGERSHRWRNFLVIQGLALASAALLLSAPLGLRWFRGGAAEAIDRRRYR